MASKNPRLSNFENLIVYIDKLWLKNIFAIVIFFENKPDRPP